MQRDHSKGAFVRGGVEVLDMPLNAFYEPPMYWEHGPARELYERVGSMNYVEILKYFIWLMQQKVHPDRAHEPIIVTLEDQFVQSVRDGFFGACLKDGDLVLLNASAGLWANYYRFSVKPLSCSVTSGHFDNAIPKRSLKPLHDGDANRAYQKLVQLGQIMWRAARAHTLLDDSWIKPSIDEFRAGRSIVWETRSVIVQKDFPTFVQEVK